MFRFEFPAKAQHFSYHRSECDRIIGARYRFPPPDDAAVKSVEVRFVDARGPAGGTELKL